jgi:NhaP-type Na+/H+ or K+/H+ antiporter
MKKKEFFKNVGTIMIFAVLGTLISILIIGFCMWVVSSTGIFGQVSKSKKYILI